MVTDDMLHEKITDSVRKWNKKEVFSRYNKSRINIGHWREQWLSKRSFLRFLDARF